MRAIFIDKGQLRREANHVLGSLFLPHLSASALRLLPFPSPRTSGWSPTFAMPGFEWTWWSAMAQYGSNLIVGSAFEYYDGVAVNQILQWDGSAWSSLGTGIEKTDCCSWVYDLVVFGPDLIVGGEFEVAGGDSARNIARWDGTGWSPMGPGLDTWVEALAIFDGTLHAGNYDGGYSWDGSSWNSLGAFDGPVYAMVPYGSTLAVAGSFNTIDGVSANDYALWDGTTWTDIGGTGSDWHINMSLAEFDGDLYAGGWFSEINGVQVRGLGRWDGTCWNEVGAEFIGDVEDLWVHDGMLYVAGSVPSYGVLENGIARWDGSAWHTLGTPIGSGTNNAVWTLADYQGNLVAGAP